VSIRVNAASPSTGPSGPRPSVARAGVLANRALATGIRWLELALPAAWGPPLPGQYVSIGLDGPVIEREPGRSRLALLRRPFSVAGYDDADGHRRLAILYAPVGRVSRRMAQLGPGAEVGVLGPLGTAFPLDGAGPMHLVAGGRGIAPMLFAAHELGRRARPFTLFYGARRAAEMIAPEGIPDAALRYATDDGSRGAAATVVELLARETRAGATLLGCGPHGMLDALARLARARGDDCWVSIEETFGCGLGTCGGCAVPAARPAGEYLWACRDGAVVRADALDWAAWARAYPPACADGEV
jgi:dihydroorotate dehydrogenase electron transfer subunit